MPYQAASRLPIFCVDKISPTIRALPLSSSWGEEAKTRNKPPLW